MRLCGRPCKNKHKIYHLRAGSDFEFHRQESYVGAWPRIDRMSLWKQRAYQYYRIHYFYLTGHWPYSTQDAAGAASSSSHQEEEEEEDTQLYDKISMKEIAKWKYASCSSSRTEEKILAGMQEEEEEDAARIPMLYRWKHAACYLSKADKKILVCIQALDDDAEIPNWCKRKLLKFVMNL